MTFITHLTSNLTTVVVIVALMTVIALVETAIPLHERGRWHATHLGPNLALTFITFATNLLMNAALLLLLLKLEEIDFGLLRVFSLAPLAAAVLAVVALDLSYYAAHVLMHKVPTLWKVHRVHHSDPVVDVTTTIRQHPAEGVIRYAAMAAAATALGVGVGAFAVYRSWSAISGLLEHANIRVPHGIDRVLSVFTTFPNMHKVHHSRDVRETDSNYGNIFPWFDRLFGTFTPSRRGEAVVCGLEGFDEPSMQTTGALLAMPVRPPRAGG